MISAPADMMNARLRPLDSLLHDRDVYRPDRHGADEAGQCPRTDGHGVLIGSSTVTSPGLNFVEFFLFNFLLNFRDSLGLIKP